MRGNKENNVNVGMMDTKETMVFYMTVAPSGHGTLKERVKAEGTIEGIRIKFAAGQEESLLVAPFLEKRKNTREPLLSYAETGNGYLAGDDDYLEFRVSRPVSNDEWICIDYNNTNETYSYTLMVLVDVDYMGGQNRIV